MIAPGWAYADLGFNTGHGLWMLEFHDAKGRFIHLMTVREVILRHGTTFQYGWPDESENPRRFWHVRQRILVGNVERLWFDGGDRVEIDFVRGIEPASEPPTPLPEGVVAIEMAYSLKDSKGFIELVGPDGKVLKELKDRWLITENLTQRTTGIYPNIRLRSEAKDVHGLVVTATTCVVVGRPVP